MTETTTPTGLHVMSVVDRMQTQASQYRYDSGFFTRDQCIAHTAEDREVRAAVAALLTREAALVAEVDLLRRVQASMATEGVALVAERDALTAEVAELKAQILAVSETCQSWDREARANGFRGGDAKSVQLHAVVTHAIACTRYTARTEAGHG